jgi:CHRD domain
MRKANVLVVLGVLALFIAADRAAAQTVTGDLIARLRGFEEVPSLVTGAGGHFQATLGEGEITYELSYSTFRGPVTQAHFHIAQRGVNGGIVVFLCSNLGNGPAGTQPCPAAPGSITGTIHASDIIGSASQGLAAGDMAGLVRAIRAGVAYANIHSTVFPGGEARGQLLFTATTP